MSRSTTAVLSLVLVLFCLTSPASARSQDVRMLNIAVPQDAPTERVYFYSTSRDEAKLLALHKKLVERGARHVDCFLPAVVVCELPVSENAQVLSGDPDFRVVFESQISDEATDEGLFGPVWVKRCYASAERSLDEQFPRTPPYDLVDTDPRVGAVFSVPVETVRRTDMGGVQSRNIQQNSEIMVGTILANLIFPESVSLPGFHENWSDESLADATAQATLAIRHYALEFKKANIHFIIRTEKVDTSSEPITEDFGSTFWIEEIMNKLGYEDDGSPDRHLTAVHEFNNDRRIESGTQWVFTAFIVDAEEDPNHQFAGAAKKRGWGYHGGPYFTIAYPGPGFYGPGDFYGASQVFKYFFASIFWAVEEEIGNYTDCNTRSGYLNYQNRNKVLALDPIMGTPKTCPGMGYPIPCIMNYVYGVEYGYGGPPCEFTAGMIGLSDDNNNSVPDALDAPPKVYFENAVVETVFTSHATIRFKVVSEGVDNQNPEQDPALRVNYAVPVESVDQLFASGLTRRLFPLDGYSDELEEDFELELDLIPGGHSEYSFVTRNAANARTPLHDPNNPPPKKELYYIGLTHLHFGYENENYGNRIQLSLLGETFDAGLDLHRINLDGDGEDTIIKTNLEPVRSTPEFTTFEYIDSVKTADRPNGVVPGQWYSYYIAGTLTSTYRDQDTTVTMTTESVETRTMIPIPGGSIVSNASPNPFKTSTLISIIVPTTYEDPDASLKKPIPTEVNVKVYDVLGRAVKRLYVDRIVGQVVTLPWDGTNDSNEAVPAGVYFVNVKAGTKTGTTKAVIVR